jgi:exonuclease III
MLQDIQPVVFFIQETKMKRAATIKTENAKNYQIDELVRKSSGSGLAIGVLHDFDPVWVGEGSDKTECLLVEISVKNARIRCICAYGPQKKDGADRKESLVFIR